MKLNIITPPICLRRFVKYFWTIEAEKSIYRQFFCADTNMKMILSNGSIFTHHSHLNMHHSYKQVKITDFDESLNHSYTKSSYAGIIGPSKEYSIVRFDGIIDVIGVEFTEIGGYFLLSCQPYNMRDSFVSIEQLKNDLLTSEWNEIRNTKDINSRINALINFFSSNIHSSNREKQDTELLENIFEKKHSTNTVKDILQNTYLCERQIRRLCLKYIGMSLSEILTIQRFHSEIYLLASNECRLFKESASEYNDQSHMNKEFCRFCGHTPSAMKTHFEKSKLMHTSKPIVKINPNNIVIIV